MDDVNTRQVNDVEVQVMCVSGVLAEDVNTR